MTVVDVEYHCHIVMSLKKNGDELMSGMSSAVVLGRVVASVDVVLTVVGACPVCESGNSLLNARNFVHAVE